MKALSTTALALIVGLATSFPAMAQAVPPATPVPDGGSQLGDIIVTAQGRETNVQATPIAITAVSGATLAKDKILSVSDFSHSVSGVSFVSNSAQGASLTIRGITNTRLTSPTADQSTSIFVDNVYVSRSGNLNTNYYDISRIELLRGPQGVLLGKSVVGGALNVISNSPEFAPSGRIAVSIGNYNLRQVTGYVTGALSDTLAARVAFQTINHSGYERDILHNVDLDNLDSIQGRASLKFQPKNSDLRINFIGDYSRDTSDGLGRVAIPTTGFCPSSCTRPLSTFRAQVSARLGRPLTIRESLPVWPIFSGDSFHSPQLARHENYNFIFKVDKDVLPGVTLTSLTGYRNGDAYTLYDQGGGGPSSNLDGGFNFPNPPLALNEPVNLIEQIHQFSQEFRLTSHYQDSRFDWILGGFYLHNKVHQFARFWAESPTLRTLSGESHWDDHGLTKTSAVFGQVGFKILPVLKLDVGVRYTHDSKTGTQQGIAVTTGDRFNPADTVPATPLAIPFGVTPYGKSWSKLTPQATLTFKPTDDVMSYVTVSTGFKGGGFQQTASKAIAAQTAYNPESLTNYELGLKLGLLDHRLRLNTALFYMQYRNLQFQRTDQTCLCNIVYNASGTSTIKGIESELQFAPVHALRLWASGTYLKTRYASQSTYAGKFLQLTPKYQLAAGAEATTNLGSWQDGLTARVSYKRQGKMYWGPDNFQFERPYGLLDGRVTVTPPGGRFTVSIYGKNLTKQVYRDFVVYIFGDDISNYGPPRTFGAEFTAKF